MLDLQSQSPEAFVRFLKDQGIRRFFMVLDPEAGALRSSHAILQPLADELSQDPDFLRHEGLFFQITRSYDVLQGAFIHGTCRGQAQGGTRFWYYETIQDYFKDGLRLSAGMTRKSALAGLWWGGGKGVMAQNSAYDSRDPAFRRSVFEEYGEFVSSLNGCYVTAEDVGTDTTDIGYIFSKTRFVTCIPDHFGGSGNPSEATARGVFRGMEAAVKFLDGGDLQGRRVAVQGCGHVGAALVKFLFDAKVGSVEVTDANPHALEALENDFSGSRLRTTKVERGDLSIISTDCDVLAPCATGAILNSETIPGVRARVICGAANNQLRDPDQDAKQLMSRGVLYVPDFLVNRMGIVQCANEQYGHVGDDPFVQRHLDRDWSQSIYQMTLKVLDRARKTGESSTSAAIRMADELATERHPLFGHRGVQIVRSLAASDWARR